MPQYASDLNSTLLRVNTAIAEFDGACDPAFDNDLDELERHFAELRLDLVRELN